MSEPHVLGENARLGFIEVPGSSEPPLPALVRIDEKSGIDIDVPLSKTNPRSEHLGDIPETPPYLHFRDDKGRLTFGGCFGRRINRNSGTGHGRWSFRAAFALEGDEHSDESVQDVVKLQSEITGLHQWMSWSNTTMTFKGPAHSPEEIEISKKILDAIEIPMDRGRMRITPTVRVKDFSFSGEESAIETLTNDAEPWSKHFALHYAVRNVVALSLWAPVDFLSHGLRHSNEESYFPGVGMRLPPTRKLHFLHHTRRVAGNIPSVEAKSEHIFYPDLGADGLAKFVQLSDTHSRAISPLMSYLYLAQVPVETQITHVGICLEALRFADRIQLGESANAANKESICDRALNLANAAPQFIVDLLGDPEEWSKKLAESYNSVKHANRVPADPGDTFWLARSGALLARVSLLHRAGTSIEAMKRMTNSPWWYPMKEGVASVLAP